MGKKVKRGGRKVLAVDIGSTKIRVCDLELIGHKPVISYYDELDIPVSPSEREEFINSEGKNFIKSQQAKSFYVSLPGRGVLVRSLAVPKVPLKKLKDILKYEVQQQIPFPLEVVEWKFQIISETAQNYNILLGAIKRDIISDFLSRLSNFGIDPLFLDIDPFAILNLFMFSPKFISDKCQAILEVGANSSNFIIIHKEKMLIRSLTTSGDTITNAIAESESISYAEAEGKKIIGNIDIPAVKMSIESLHTEIQNSIDYWRFTQKGPEVEELYLCGRSMLLQGIKEFIQEKSRIQTFYFSPFVNIDINAEYNNLRSSETEFAVLIGIALRKIRRTTINIDLLPEEIERLREFRYNRPYIYLSAIMAGLIAITPSLFFNQEKSMLKGLLNEIDLSLQQYEKYKPDVDKLKGEIDEIKGRVDIIEKVINEKDIWLRRIITLGNTLPSSRIYIVSLIPGEATPSAGPTQEVQGMPQGVPEMPPAPPGAAPPPGAPPMPGEIPQPTQQPAADIKVEEEKIFTLNGEVIITDIRTAFSDFKTFVTKLSELEFIKSVNIKSCEVSPTKEKLEFSLLVEMQ
ncbi:MAG: pilus assembly protein PilM [Candidatus Ratteibacteria bacterium]|nr:pilus assembly protein PilM [Candidatus Ratteibacteria bacterium]